MEFLLWLQSIRTPAVHDAALFISLLCDKILLISIFCWLFWCADKNKAYGLAFSFVLSGLAVQGIKIFARVPRPFVRNNNIKPSQAAIETATGYSFPSGHTQTAASLLGYAAFSVKSVFLKLLSFALIFLVMLSRMVLGVHTPSDVGVSFVLTILVVAAVKQAEKWQWDKYFRVIAPVGAGVSLCLGIIAYAFIASGITTYALAHDCIVMSVCSFVFFVCWYLEKRFIGFDTGRTFSGNSGLGAQIVKFLAGMAGLLVIYSVFGLAGGAVFGIVKYAAVFVWICLVYPLCIRKMKKGK